MIQAFVTVLMSSPRAMWTVRCRELGRGQLATQSRRRCRRHRYYRLRVSCLFRLLEYYNLAGSEMVIFNMHAGLFTVIPTSRLKRWQSLTTIMETLEVKLDLIRPSLEFNISKT